MFLNEYSARASYDLAKRRDASRANFCMPRSRTEDGVEAPSPTKGTSPKLKLALPSDASSSAVRMMRCSIVPDVACVARSISSRLYALPDAGESEINACGDPDRNSRATKTRDAEEGLV